MEIVRKQNKHKRKLPWPIPILLFIKFSLMNKIVCSSHHYLLINWANGYNMVIKDSTSESWYLSVGGWPPFLLMHGVAFCFLLPAAYLPLEDHTNIRGGNTLWRKRRKPSARCRTAAWHGQSTQPHGSWRIRKAKAPTVARNSKIVEMGSFFHAQK